MTVYAGYGASIKKSGTSTGFTGEDMTNTAGFTWQIDTATKQVWDKAVVPTFYLDAVEIDANDVSSVDYLYGKVTFTGVQDGVVTVDGNYYPMSEIAGAKEISLVMTSAIHDKTDTSNAGYIERMYGIHDVSVDLGRFDDISKDFTDIIQSRTSIVLEVAPESSYSMRGWFIADSSGQSLDVNSLIEEGLNFQLDGDEEVGKTFSTSS